MLLGSLKIRAIALSVNVVLIGTYLGPITALGQVTVSRRHYFHSPPLSFERFQ